jgi:hypothetical protein
MTPAEAEAFLGRCRVMVVGAIDDCGWPTGEVALTTYDGQAVQAELDPDGGVIEAIANDGRVCLLADEHASYFEIKGVIVHGRAAASGSPGAVRITAEHVISFDFGRLRLPAALAA